MDATQKVASLFHHVQRDGLRMSDASSAHKNTKECFKLSDGMRRNAQLFVTNPGSDENKTH